MIDSTASTKKFLMVSVKVYLKSPTSCLYTIQGHPLLGRSFGYSYKGALVRWDKKIARFKRQGKI